MKQAGKVVVLVALVAVLALPLGSSLNASSEEDACARIVLDALSATDEMCEGTGRNQACYGHIQLNAEPHTDVQLFKFDEEGDIVDVFEMQSLRLTPMDTELGVFGIALMRLQASLPSVTAKNVTLLLFGEVEMTNAVESVVLLDVTPRNLNALNVRLLPSSEAKLVAAIQPGDIVSATGRLEDTSWVRVQLADNRVGWVFARLLASDGDLETLDIVTPNSPVPYSPMQAFYFQSGHDDAACTEAPNSGLLIQTPEGVGSVTFLINEVNIQLGSTVFFEADPGGEMTVSVVEGSATVTTGNMTYRATAGTEVAVPMDEDMKPAGPPSPPRPYDMDKVRSLPLSLLERSITIHPPLTTSELAEYMATPEATGGTSVLPDDGEGGGWESAPGLGGAVPPGHGGDTPPGQIGREDKEVKEKEEKPPKEK